LPLAAFIVGGVVLPLLLVIPAQRSFLDDQTRAGALRTAELAGHALARALATGRVADLKDEITVLKRKYPAFAWISVTGPAGRVLTHTDPAEEGKLLLDLFPPPVSTIVQSSQRGGMQVLTVTIPLVISAEVRGAMQAELTVASAAQSWTGVDHLAALTICLLGLGMLVAVHLARSQTAARVIVRERVVTERIEEKPPLEPPPADELLAAVVEATPAALLVVDEVTRKILHANGAFCRLWGLEDLEDQLRDTTAAYDVVATRCNAAAESPVLAFPLGSAEIDPLRLIDEELRCHDGRVVHCFSLPLAWNGRHVRLYVGTDVTAQKRREEGAATASEAARVTLQTKAAFIAQVARTLRAPLNGLIGTTGLLLETKLTAQQSTYAETVQVSAEEVLTMVNNILDLAAIDAGELHLSPTDFDLTRLVHESLEPFGSIAQRKSIELAVTVADAVPRGVCGDPDRLRQVLGNLVSSAVHITDCGEVVVHVSAAAEVAPSAAGLHIATDGSRTRAHTARQPAAQVTLRFEVRDTGHGITPERQAALFHVLGAQSAEAQYRTHLPLLVAKRLVELMGGHVGVESDARGSTVWFTVPLRVAPEAARDATVSIDAFHTSRVLIVDDNATVRTGLERQLRAWHITSESAADGHEAMRCLRAAVDRGSPYDLAIIDAQMPDMDGLTLADAIQREPKLGGLPLFLLTSGARVAIDAHPGIAATLTKPVHPSPLYDSLVTLLADGGTQRQTISGRASTTGTTSSRGRLLLAEDNLVNQKIALRMLDKLGYQTDTVTNGREAVAAAQRVHYDAILMDCQMPEMDGVTAAGIIRQGEGTDRHTPIIAVTANSAEADRERCLAAGMDDFLAKPVRATDLETILEQWTSAASSDDSAAAGERLRILPRAAQA
jgi:CheY-like chemotaxis protein/signal transduction histidine kinase